MSPTSSVSVLCIAAGVMAVACTWPDPDDYEYDLDAYCAARRDRNEADSACPALSNSRGTGGRAAGEVGGTSALNGTGGKQSDIGTGGAQVARGGSAGDENAGGAGDSGGVGGTGGTGEVEFRARIAGPFVDVATAREFACGLADDGTVTCWDAEIWPDSAPGGAFTAISADGRACGLRADATVTCWREAFEETTSPDGTFSSISAGYTHGCGLRTDGTIDCWGADHYGQADAPAGQFLSVSAGYSHTCAIGEDRSLTCWGDDTNGKASPPDGEFSSVSVGFDHSCALDLDGVPQCWGTAHSYSYWIFDDGWPIQTSLPRGPFTQVAAGGYASCLLAGQLDCFGPGANDDVVPTATMSDVDLGGGRACALETSGDIVCWGG